MVLCNQNDIALEIDNNDVINDLAKIKARRKPLLYKYSNSTKNKDVQRAFDDGPCNLKPWSSDEDDT
ncbi:hypothetical protein TNCV_4706581 [Trichonephila clavipes]|nr:hypothetical protein TNCV_4706581 [Trichonephila clavipes]